MAAGLAAGAATTAVRGGMVRAMTRGFHTLPKGAVPLGIEAPKFVQDLRDRGLLPPGADSGQPVVIPSTGERIGFLPCHSAEEYHRCVARSQAASVNLRAIGLRQRGEFFREFSRLLSLNVQNLKSLLSYFCKTSREAEVEIREAQAVLDMRAGDGFQPRGTLYASDKEGEVLENRWVPAGNTSAQLVPTNFPASIMMKHLCDSISAGVPQIVKAPTTAGALVTLYMKTLFDEAARNTGLPEDALLVVVGDHHLGQLMSMDERFCTIAGTGGARMVSSVRKAAAIHGTRTILEGSGHNLVVVMSEEGSPSARHFVACLPQAMGGMGALRCSTAHTFVLGPRSYWAREAIIEAASQFVQSAGDPRHPETVMTALYSPRHLEQLTQDTLTSVRSGGQSIDIGRPNIPVEFSAGFWATPQLLQFYPGHRNLIIPTYGPTWSMVSLPEHVIFEYLRSQESGLTNSIFTDSREDEEAFLASSQSGVCNINTPPNGNPVGTLAGFTPGTPASGGVTSRAGSLEGWQHYSRHIFTRRSLK